MPIVMANNNLSPVSQFYELLSLTKLTPELIDLEIDYGQTGCGLHTCVVTCNIDGQNYLGQSANVLKRTAKCNAFEDILTVVELPLREKAQEVRATLSPSSPEVLAKPFMYECVKQHLRVAAKVCRFEIRPVVVIDDKLPDDAEVVSFQDPETKCMINYHRVVRDNKVIPYCLSSTVQALKRQLRYCAVDVYLAQPCTSRGDSDSKVLLDTDNVPNASNPREMPVEPVAQVGVQDNPGTNTIPHLPNPQPTAVTPAVAAQDPSLVAALEPLAPHETLNPLGPPNMLGVGGVTFDIKDLIYSQYIDCDQQYTYTDDTAQGAIIFQIEYDPTGPLINPYIRQWLQLHPRYTGALNFRFTVVGNSTFSGLIGFAWYPRKIDSNTVKVSEMMKYSYTTMGINQPSNRIFTLFDARQRDFWRDVNDDPKSNPRPVLVAFIYMTAVSPLKEGITIRIRVASKLSDGSDGPAFMAAMPTLPTSKAEVGVPAPTGLDVNYVSSLIGLPIVPVLARPLSTLDPLFICLDGDSYSPNYVCDTIGDLTFESYPYILGNGWDIGGATSAADYAAAGYAYTRFEPGKPRQAVLAVDMSHYVGVGGLGQGFINFSRSQLSNEDYIQADNTWLNDSSVNVNLITELGGYSTENVMVKFLNEEIGISKSYICIIYTTAGPIIVYQYNLVSAIKTSDAFLAVPTMTALKTAPTTVDRMFDSVSSRPENMPAGWRALRICCDAPWLMKKGFSRSTLYNHPSVQNIFKDLAIPVSSTQCVAFTISDMDSGVDLVYGRFYKDRDQAIVNLGPDQGDLYYATLKRPSIRLYLSSLNVIERINTFPITDAQHFSSNVPLTTRVRRLKPYDPRSDGVIYPNAMIPALIGASEGMKGVGNALGGIGNYYVAKEQRDWQGSENQKNRDLMSEQGDLNRELQRWLAEYSGGNMFKYQENQNSFLSALSAQNSNQWLYNQEQLAAFNYQMQGYTLPSSQRGLNRAGLGMGFRPTTSVFRNSGTQASPETMSSSTQVVSPPGRDVTTQGSQTQSSASGALGKNPNVKLRRSNAFRSYDRSNASSFGALPQRRVALTTAGSSEV